jgi:septal ring factor EnvC (AmiA/AmiB activator)
MKQELNTEPAPRLSANWMHFLYAGLILLVCVAFYQGAQTENLLRLVVSAQGENAALRKNLSRSEDEFRQSLVRFHTELSGLQEQLSTARLQADSSLDAAKAATVYADALGGKLEKKRRDQEKRQQQLSAQLSKVEKSTDETSARLNGISNEVGGVRDTLASVRAVATRNIDELQHARGDVSELKDGVATNSKQIETLRELGDKRIVEFNLTKSAGLQRVGDIQLKLNRTDEKRNTFTLEIAADDKLVEKRDRTINEPVEFFISSKPAKAYELVVNEVGKNMVKGYLAAPKETYVRD